MGRCLGALLELQGIDRAMVLASQAFTALIPLLILVSALAPSDSQDAVAEAIIGRFRLRDAPADDVRQLFLHPAGATTGVLSVLLLVISALSFTRRLQRMYVQVWRLPRGRGLRNSFNALLGLAALVVELGLLSFAQSLVQPIPAGWVLGVPLSAVAAIVLWTSIPWLLLDRRRSWRSLLPAGALTGLCTGLYAVATTIYMPRLFASYSLKYGLFGVILALVGWLVAVCFIVVVATIVAAEFDRAPEPWAATLRSRLAPRASGSSCTAQPGSSSG